MYIVFLSGRRPIVSFSYILPSHLSDVLLDTFNSYPHTQYLKAWKKKKLAIWTKNKYDDDDDEEEEEEEEKGDKEKHD